MTEMSDFWGKFLVFWVWDNFHIEFVTILVFKGQNFGSKGEICKKFGF